MGILNSEVSRNCLPAQQTRQAWRYSMIHHYFKGCFILFACFSTPLLAQRSEYENGKGKYPNRVFFNLEQYWDTTKVCNNPHKGWTLHYYDNGLARYGNKLSPQDSLADFPCLNDIYLRLAWAYLEPAEGQYNWAVLDSIITRWTQRGHTISFRITSKETDDHLPYAVPEWVVKAGAKGKMVPNSAGQAWAPDYGDPVFLAKLENFHRAFAARYDGQPWVEYIDIGSIGEWGEGHTLFSGYYDVPVSVIKKHLDLFRKYYKKSTLIISDDIMGLRKVDDGADEEILAHCLKLGIGFRDDSVYVPWYAEHFGASQLRLPEIFNKVYKRIPVVLESDHYTTPVQKGIYKKGLTLEKAVEEMHATMVGFHHYPREWLQENQALARRLGNKSGYYYFPKYALLPDTLRKNSAQNYLKLTWENHGVAPAYQPFTLFVKLSGGSGKQPFTQQLRECDVRSWLPSEIITEKYKLNLPASLTAGKYDVLIQLRDYCEFHRTPLQLPLQAEREVEKGWYKIGEIVVR